MTLDEVKKLNSSKAILEEEETVKDDQSGKEADTETVLEVEDGNPTVKVKLYK